MKADRQVEDASLMRKKLKSYVSKTEKQVEHETMIENEKTKAKSKGEQRDVSFQ